MAPTARDQWEQDRMIAEEALRTAQAMPAGPERIAALRRAGQMRFDANSRRELNGKRALERTKALVKTKRVEMDGD